MSCYRCQRHFSLFVRSTGCEICNFLFCSKCCDHFVFGGEKKKVCESCRAKWTTTSQASMPSAGQMAPPPYSAAVPNDKNYTATHGLGVGDVSTSSASTGERSPASSPSMMSRAEAIRQLPPSQRKAAEARLLSPQGDREKRRPSPSASPTVDQRAFQHLPPSQRKAAIAKATHAAKQMKDPEDAVLENRLAELKQKANPTVQSRSTEGESESHKPECEGASELAADDIEGRLARLMGVDRNRVVQQQSADSVLHRPPQLTASEEVELLLSQTNDEVQLDDILSGQDQRLHARLNNLRGTSPQPSGSSASAAAGKPPAGDEAGEFLEGLAPADNGQRQQTVGSEASALLKDMMAAQDSEQQAADAALAADADLLERVAQLAAKHGKAEATSTVADERGQIDFEKQFAKGAGLGDMFEDLSDDADSDGGFDDEGTGVKKLLAQLQAEAVLDDELEQAGLADALRPKKDTKPQDTEAPSASKTSDAPAVLSGAQQPVAAAVGAAALYNDPYRVPDELPWCTICNANAVVRCLDCDSDLYCKRCFVDGHREFAIEDHQIVKYLPPPRAPS